MAACCWSEEKVERMLTNFSDHFEDQEKVSVLRLRDKLKARTAEIKEQNEQLNGADGLFVLNITETEWRREWQVIFQNVRSSLMYLWEILWDFQRPLMCPAGSFCNAGTCADLPQTGIVEVDFNAESSAGSRRLTGTTSLEARKKRSAKLLDTVGMRLSEEDSVDGKQTPEE